MLCCLVLRGAVYLGVVWGPLPTLPYVRGNNEHSGGASMYLCKCVGMYICMCVCSGVNFADTEYA